MSLKIDRVQLEIEIKTDTNRQRLRELDKELSQTSRELKKAKEGTEEHAKASEHYKKLRAEYDQIISKIGLTNMSLKELKARQAELNMIIRNLDPSSKSYKELKSQLEQVKGRLRELNGHAKQTGFSLGKMADGFNKYFGIVTASVASFAGIIMGARQAIDLFAQFEDQVSDVMKTTGLTKQEVIELDKELQKINTRSAQEDLLGLARVAGKLGITGKKDIEGFVRAADQIKVALSEDLGGDVEESINQVGKLTEIFGLQSEFGIEQSILKVGSVINELGAASTANEGYIVEFTKRMAGVAPTAKISAANVMGLAATLDQYGQQVEMSSTAVAGVVTEMFKSPGEFARIAGMSIKDFNSLLNTDSNEALIRFLEGLNGNNDGLGAMAAKLDDLGIDGKRAISVLGVLSNNTETLRKQQTLANDEFAKGTSLTEEFNIKNNNAQALLEKKRKALTLLRAEFGEKLAPVMTFSTSLQTIFLKAIMNAPEIINAYKHVIAALITVLLIWQQQKIKNAWAILYGNITMKQGIGLKIHDTVVLQKLIIQEQIRNATLNKTTIAQKLAAAASVVLRNALALLGGPIGWIIALLGALVVGLMAYDKYSAKSIALANDKKEALDRLALSNKLLNDAYIKINSSIEKLASLSVQEKQDLRDKIDLTLQLAEAEILNMEVKQKQVQTDNTRTSAWSKFVIILKSMGNAGKASVNMMTAAAENGIDAARELSKPIVDLRENLQKIKEQKGTLDDIFGAEKAGDAIKGDSIVALEEKINKYQLALRNAAIGSEDFTRIQNKLIASKEKLNKLTQQTTKLTDKERKKREKEAEDKLKKQREIEKSLIDLMKDGFDKELALEKFNYQEKMNWIDKEVKDKVEAQKHYELLYSQHVDRLKKISTKHFVTDPFSKEAEKHREENNLPEVYLEAEKASTDSKAIEEDPRIKQEILYKAYELKLFQESKAHERQLLKEHLDKNLISQKEYEDKVLEINREAIQKKSDDLIAFFGSLESLQSSFSQFQVNDIEADKERLKASLDEKLISQDNYDSQMKKLNEESKKAERKAALTRIGFDTAKAITALVAYAAQNPANAVTMGLAGYAVYIEGFARIIANIAMAKKYLQGHADGKYPVRATTGNYMATIAGSPLTGLYSSPTAFIAGEKGTELIVDNATLGHVQANFPAAIDAIYHSRRSVRGYADGKYPDTDSTLHSSKLTEGLSRLNTLLDRIDTEGVSVSYAKLEKSDAEVNNIKNVT